MTTKKFLIPSTPWRPFPRKAAILRGGHAFSGREASLRVEIETFCGHRFRVGRFLRYKGFIRSNGRRAATAGSAMEFVIRRGRSEEWKWKRRRLFLLSNGDKPGIRKFLESVFRGCPFACRRTAGSSLFRSRKTFSWQGGRRLKGEKEGFHEQEGEWSRRRGNGIENEKPCSLPFLACMRQGEGREAL